MARAHSRATITIITLVVIAVVVYDRIVRRARKCRDIDRQKEPFTAVGVVRGVLSSDECAFLVARAESAGWLLDRHENYPTTDVEIDRTWVEYNPIVARARARLFPAYELLFPVDRRHLEIDDLFVAKYDAEVAGAQRELRPHQDASEFSFVVALNDAYEGGGTRFMESGRTVRVRRGDALIFCGRTRHSGVPITRGERYILAGFVRYRGGCD